MIHIELAHVSKSYDSPEGQFKAVQDVSWQARGGEIFGVLGPNGAGKTSMIRMILDIIRPQSGQVIINNDPTLNRTQEFKRMVGYLPEERGLYKNRTIDETLEYFGVLKGLSAAECHARATHFLERFELIKFRKRKIEQLSKGLSQKVQILACILHDPSLIILDEPFSGLDPLNVRLVRELIVEMKAAGKLVCLSTHIMPEVEALCDRLCLLKRGAMIVYGDLPSIRQNFATEQSINLQDVRLEDVLLRYLSRD